MIVKTRPGDGFGIIELGMAGPNGAFVQDTYPHLIGNFQVKGGVGHGMQPDPVPAGILDGFVPCKGIPPRHLGHAHKMPGIRFDLKLAVVQIKIPMHVPENELVEIIMIVGTQRTKFEQKINALKAAARDPLFIDDLQEISQDFEDVDLEDWDS